MAASIRRLLAYCLPFLALCFFLQKGPPYASYRFSGENDQSTNLNAHKAANGFSWESVPPPKGPPPCITATPLRPLPKPLSLGLRRAINPSTRTPGHRTSALRSTISPSIAAGSRPKNKNLIIHENITTIDGYTVHVACTGRRPHRSTGFKRRASTTYNTLRDAHLQHINHTTHTKPAQQEPAAQPPPQHGASAISRAPDPRQSGTLFGT
ncbi:hypothetical protein C8R45DRAFT_921501 [Mycena sanguinolenta]|nr:hypothetical protein C8R45DRAFT_921501 [Mycena sanguinolenta]